MGAFTGLPNMSSTLREAAAEVDTILLASLKADFTSLARPRVRNTPFVLMSYEKDSCLGLSSLGKLTLNGLLLVVLGDGLGDG